MPPAGGGGGEASAPPEGARGAAAMGGEWFRRVGAARRIEVAQLAEGVPKVEYGRLARVLIVVVAALGNLPSEAHSMGPGHDLAPWAYPTRSKV